MLPEIGAGISAGAKWIGSKLASFLTGKAVSSAVKNGLSYVFGSGSSSSATQENSESFTQQLANTLGFGSEQTTGNTSGIANLLTSGLTTPTGNNSLLAYLINQASTNKANSQSQANFNTALTYNAAQAQINRDWMTDMSNTAHQREVADLEEAGLNPVLSATGGSGASTPSASSAYSPMLPEIQAARMTAMQNYGNNTIQYLNNAMKFINEAKQLKEYDYAETVETEARQVVASSGYTMSTYADESRQEYEDYQREKSRYTEDYSSDSSGHEYGVNGEASIGLNYTPKKNKIGF